MEESEERMTILRESVSRLTLDETWEEFYQDSSIGFLDEMSISSTLDLAVIEVVGKKKEPK